MAEVPCPVWSTPDREIWLADCLDPDHVAAVMGDRQADLLCFDAPFSEQTHSGHAAGRPRPEQLARYAERGGAMRNSQHRAVRVRYEAARAAEGIGRRAIEYPHWAPSDVDAFVALWHPLARGWLVTITDHVLAPAWIAALGRTGRLVFPPLPLVETGSRCRMTGDGPSNWTCWIIVARPRCREFAEWGTLRGAYIVPGERAFNGADGSDRVVGGKSLAAMRQIIADYSRPGDLVVDPTSGGGTTLRAAIREGRRCIGLEKMPEHAQLSAQACGAERPSGQQRSLFEEVSNA